jgi:hypothetical protein
MKRQFTPEEQAIYDRADDGTKRLLDQFGFDAFDDYDCRPGGSSPIDFDVLPEHIRQMLASGGGQ